MKLFNSFCDWVYDLEIRGETRGKRLLNTCLKPIKIIIAVILCIILAFLVSIYFVFEHLLFGWIYFIWTGKKWIYMWDENEYEKRSFNHSLEEKE